MLAAGKIDEPSSPKFEPPQWKVLFDWLGEEEQQEKQEICEGLVDLHWQE